MTLSKECLPHGCSVAVNDNTVAMRQGLREVKKKSSQRFILFLPNEMLVINQYLIVIKFNVQPFYRNI